MTDRDALTDWVGRYLKAWDSNDPEDIGALFSADAEYRGMPGGPPVVGREAIVADWLDRRDEPGDHEFSWEPLAVDGDVAVVQGRTLYRDAADWDNLWVLRLRPDGTASSFTEWAIEPPAG
jgi:ketosteroid isomerase-like protein